MIKTTKILNKMFSFHYVLPLACSLSSFTTACLQSSNLACKGTTRQFMMALKQTTTHLRSNCLHFFQDGLVYLGADMSLARPGRKQATSTKLKPLKNNSEGCPSNQVSAAAMTSASDEKWRTFNCLFSRVGLKTYQHPCI